MASSDCRQPLTPSAATDRPTHTHTLANVCVCVCGVTEAKLAGYFRSMYKKNQSVANLQ